ncbi:MAG: hypothetical protein Q9202_004330 [Teloschistes flavicans]
MNRSGDHFAWHPNGQGYHARRGNYNPNNFNGHSNSASPIHGTPNHAAYHSPQPVSQLSHHRRQVLDFTNHDHSNAVPHPGWNGQDDMNGMNGVDGSGPHGHFGFTAPHPQPPQEIPHIQPTFSTPEERQRYAQDLMEALNIDKKQVLAARQGTAAEIKRLEEEIEKYELAQIHLENLRFIYPLQLQLDQQQIAHDKYGREWDTLGDLIEMLWAEMMVPGG